MTGMSSAARRYAKAVFELAQEEGHLEEWRQRLSVLRDVFTDETVAAVLTNPTLPLSTRMELISAPSTGLDEESINLAKLLIESNRVRQISAIVDEYETLADSAAGRVRATVTTAIELTTADRDRVVRELSKRLGKEISLRLEVDPAILGGLKLQYGDHLVDASVATRLQQLRRRLAEAS
ncbi:MAG: F0F1 ATP synthase subunit delta [Candidatus Dormibacteraceae bacterium]